MNRHIRPSSRATFFLALFFCWMSVNQSLAAKEITLNSAIDIALNRTPRSEIIRGAEEVAEQNLYAKKINFLLPEISINGDLPALSKDQSYRFFGGSTDKSLYETRNLDFNSFIELRQSVPITGGSFTATANLTQADNRYPDTRLLANQTSFVDEFSREGFFRFSLEQQLFRPSISRKELKDDEDSYEIAKLTRHEGFRQLEREVIEAYVGTIELEIKNKVYEDKRESAKIQADIDSAKLKDEILSEENYLESVSKSLDAELELFEVQSDLDEKRRELALLLDLDAEETLSLSVPEIDTGIDLETSQRLIAASDRSLPILKAEYALATAERSAEFAASGHGLTGDLKADYNFGRQSIETDRYSQSVSGRLKIDDNVKTAGWSLRLEFKLPLWDGGAGAASVKAARFTAEQSRLELLKEKKNARSEIKNILNRLSVSRRRLSIIRQQVRIAKGKLEIAKKRMANGEISKLTFLESRISFLETKEKQVQELKNYLTSKVDLESKFAG